MSDRLRWWWFVPAGALGGATLGATARAWMRVISNDPEFTWNGTMFIVLGFTLFGTGQALARLGRERGRRRWVQRVARTLGAVTVLPLFLAAGAVMAPTVIGGGLAVHRPAWRRAWRALAALVAAAPVVLVTRDIVHDHGWSPRSLVGVLGLVAVYGGVVTAGRATFAEPVVVSRALRTGFALAGAFGALLFAVAMVGLR